MSNTTIRQAPQEKSAIPGFPGAANMLSFPEGIKEEMPGSTGAENRSPRNCTVRNRKNHKRKYPSNNRCGKTAATRASGYNIPAALPEAAGILKSEGFDTWTKHGHTPVFHLLGLRGQEILRVRVISPNRPVRNARDVRELYEPVIREMETFWHSDADNLQLWVFSREKGLIRYRIFNWGIWNVETMQKFMKTTRDIQQEQ